MTPRWRGEITAHQVGHIWDIRRALDDQDLSTLVVAAAEYVNLLGYEAIHGKEHDTYGGTEGDTTAVRADLRKIPGAQELYAERGSLWRPSGRRR